MSQPEHDPTTAVLVDVALFATCSLPGCDTLVTDPTQPCQGCQAAFGDLLRRVESDQTSEQITAELAARDAAVAHMYRRRRELLAAAHTGDPDAARLARMQTRLIAQIPAAGGDRKPNQTCWLCEERHTCTKTDQGWECDTCRDVR
jgi:hypothetical protein